jgi:hypothetical protein
VRIRSTFNCLRLGSVAGRCERGVNCGQIKGGELNDKLKKHELVDSKFSLISRRVDV